MTGLDTGIADLDLAMLAGSWFSAPIRIDGGPTYIGPGALVVEATIDTPIDYVLEAKPSTTIAIGDRLTLPNWDTDQYVTVEWVGDATFGAIRSRDGYRTMYTADGRTQNWRPWTAPPERKTIDVSFVTEHRQPEDGEVFISPEGHLSLQGLRGDVYLGRADVVIGGAVTA